MITRPLLLLALLAMCAPAWAEMRVELVPTRHRTVDELLPILRPLLAEGATLTGMNNQLIIKSTDANIAEIKQVLDSLDRRLRSLMIHVRRNSGAETQGSGGSLSGAYKTGDVTIENRDPSRDRNGVSVGVGDRDGDHVRLNARDRRVVENDSGTYRVQTLEGQPAFIQTGQLVPIPQRTVTASPYGVVQHDSVQFYDASSGFYVIPRLSGDQVQLMISPYMTQVNPGAPPSFDVQNVETTIIGRLGEWIPLGGVVQSSQRTENGVLSSDRFQRNSQAEFSVLVEELP